MKVVTSPQLDRFREECRDWLAENVPRGRVPIEGEALRDFDLAWQRRQFDGGWAGVSWPTEYGGRGLSVIEQLVWLEEYARAGAPQSRSMFVALSHAGPTLIVRGSDAQKSRHLLPILKGEENWCQGFSEPGAGSDLASLKCRAVIDGDELVVNGTKIWTTYGHLARWQELLVRTDPDLPRHRGLTWVICDMQSAGLEVRPIETMSGVAHFAQCFYDDVRIPIGNVVGDFNNGWQVAMTTLGFERGTGTVMHQIELSETVDTLIAQARALPGRNGRGRLIDEEGVAGDLATLKMEVMALRSLTAASISRGLSESVPGAESTIVALYFGELTRRVHGSALDLLGPAALARTPGAQDWAFRYLESFKWAIGGGTSEIRRNVIAERVLGLPKGARP